jgi:hypothetical protein
LGWPLPAKGQGVAGFGGVRWGAAWALHPIAAQAGVRGFSGRTMHLVQMMRLGRNVVFLSMLHE